METKYLNDVKQKLKDLIDPPSSHFIEISFIHKSFYHESKESQSHNELLEILGDAILDAIIIEYLLELFPNGEEGEITVIKTYLVNEETLAQLFRELELNQYIKLGKGEEETGGRYKPSIESGCFEALIGGLYKTFGWDKTKELIRSIFSSKINEIKDWRDYLDPKSKLQHFVQKHKLSLPEYEVIESEGPDHQKSFTVKVSIGGSISAVAKGGTKKKAQQEAAKKLLEIIKEKKDEE